MTNTAKSLQSCLTLCDPIDGSPGSPVPGILQERTLEWVALSFSNAWKWKVKVNSLSCVRLLATPWTAAYQGPPSMGFSRQEYWSGMPLPYQVTNTTIYVFWLRRSACRISWPGSNPCPLQWKHGVLTTASPGKSLSLFVYSFLPLSIYLKVCVEHRSCLW